MPRKVKSQKKGQRKPMTKKNKPCKIPKIPKSHLFLNMKRLKKEITYDILNEIATNQLYNFNDKLSSTQLGKTVLNMKYLSLKLPDTVSDASKKKLHMIY